MASVVAILDVKGKPLIQRSYRDDVDISALERFFPLLTEIEEEQGAGAIRPCLSSQGVNYMHVRHNNLYCTYLMHSLCLSISSLASQQQCCRDSSFLAQAGGCA